MCYLHLLDNDEFEEKFTSLIQPNRRKQARIRGRIRQMRREEKKGG
jgi:hypothetical protein